MKESFRQELIAPCGMNCGICIGYFGYATNGRKRKNICEGCRIRDKNCAFIKKQCEKLSKKEVEYCFECEDFPCENLEKLDKCYQEKYDMSMIKNLEFIKENGINLFLKQQGEKYKCPNCGGVICVHNKKCYNCEI